MPRCPTKTSRFVTRRKYEGPVRPSSGQNGSHTIRPDDLNFSGRTSDTASTISITEPAFWDTHGEVDSGQDGSE